MSTAAELGISEQEFRDAMNLERIYALLNRGSGRCSKCSSSASHVDCSTYQWLCESHAVGRGNCRKIGDDRFASLDIEKLEKKYGGSRHSGGSSNVVKSSRSDRNRKSRKSKRLGRYSKRRRSPSTADDSYSESDTSEDDYPPVKTRSRSARPSRAQPSFASAFDEDFGSPTGGGMPGMAGILQQQQQQPHGFGGMNNRMSGMQQSQPMFPSSMGMNPMGQYGNMAGVLFGNQLGMMGTQGMNSNNPMMMNHMGQRIPSMFNSSIGQGGMLGTNQMPSSSIMGMQSQQRPPFVGNQFQSQMGIGMNSVGPGNPFRAGNQFSSQMGGEFGPQRPFNSMGGFGMQQQKPNPFMNSINGINNCGMGQQPFYPSSQQQRAPFSNVYGAQRPFMSIGGGSQIQREHFNPHMFNSVRSIPNLSAGQRDWWE